MNKLRTVKQEENKSKGKVSKADLQNLKVENSCNNTSMSVTEETSREHTMTSQLLSMSNWESEPKSDFSQMSGYDKIVDERLVRLQSTSLRFVNIKQQGFFPSKNCPQHY